MSSTGRTIETCADHGKGENDNNTRSAGKLSGSVTWSCDNG